MAWCFFFGCLGIFQTFINARENKDAFFTAALPVNKRDVVRAKCQLLAAAQLGQLLLTVPFALLRVVLLPNGNPAGIEANVAYFGCGLLIYAAFNAVFLISFYKTAYKAGKAFLLGVIPVTLGIGVMETLAMCPGWPTGSTVRHPLCCCGSCPSWRPGLPRMAAAWR